MILPVGKAVFRAAASLLVAGTILLAVFAWRLSVGPVSLAFLTPYLNEALALGDAGFQAEVEDTILTWGGWGRTLDVRAVNVAVKGKDGRSIATIPQVSITVSVQSLVQGEIQPTEIKIIGASFRAERKADGEFDLGLDLGGQPVEAKVEGQSEFLGALLNELADPPGEGFFGLLRRVGVTDADLAIKDEQSGAVWRAAKAQLELIRIEHGVNVQLAIDLDLGDRTTHITAAGLYDPAVQGLGARVTFDDLYLPALSAKLPIPLPDEIKGVALPIDGSIGFSLNSKAQISALDFDIVGASGEIKIASLRTDPYLVRKIAIKGRIADSRNKLWIEDGHLDLNDVSFQFAGTLEQAAPGKLSYDLAVAFNSLSVEGLGRHWPANIATDARTWVARHIKAGRIYDAALRVKLTPEMLAASRLPPQAIALDFKLEGVAAEYVAGLPWIEEAKGQGHLSAAEFNLNITEARVEKLMISEGTLLISDIDLKEQKAEANFITHGEVSDILSVIDRDPLKLAAGLGVKPADIAGSAAVRTRLNFGLDKSLDEIDVVAAANLKDVAVPNLAEGYGVSGGDFTLRVTKANLDLEGKAKLNNVPLSVKWKENFLTKDFPSTYQVSGILDDKARAALGFDTQPYVSGPISLDANIQIDRKNGFRAAARGELKDARLIVDELRWQKPVGAPVGLDVQLMSSGPKAIEVSALRLNGEGINLRGALRIEDGKPNHIAIRELRYGNNQLSVSARHDSDGIWRLAVEGAQFDLRPFTMALFEDEPDEVTARALRAKKPEGVPINLVARFDTLILTDDHLVNNFQASIVRRNDVWREVDARGHLSDTAPLFLRIWPEGKIRKTNLVSENAGAVFQSLGITNSVIGGALTIDGVIRDDLPDAPVQGKAVINDFKMVRAPLLAKVLNIGSFAGIAQLLSGEGITFARGEVPFSLSGATIRVNDARAWGSAMGFTSTGSIDFGGSIVNLGGTIVPSYTINTALGYIPLIGKIFTSREGEGVFGATYQITGPLIDPRVNVNGLSALAPGILRRMFEPGDGDPKAPQAEAVP